jgi:L-ascorbate metabolism protein UlaG (beta-lactamase superfamily)
MFKSIVANIVAKTFNHQATTQHKSPQKTTSLPTITDLQETWFVPEFQPSQIAISITTQFRHPWSVPKPGMSVLKWLITRRQAKWPVWEENPSVTALPHSRPDAAISDWKVWFVGHATVLIQIGPYNFLTDPVWAMRVSPANFAGPKRVRPAGIALEDLPTIDAILLSHNHYDHLDKASLYWLYERDRMPIYTGLANGQYLPASMRVIELDWWESAKFDKDDRLKIVFTPAQHFSGRGLKDRNMALWGGLSILTPEDHLFFAGDTGYAQHFSEVRTRLGAPRLALLPIGAYEPRAVMQAMHMNPTDAVQAHQDLQATQSLAIHHRTFQLTDEAMNQPLLDLANALSDANIAAESFATPTEGEMVMA